MFELSVISKHPYCRAFHEFLSRKSKTVTEEYSLVDFPFFRNILILGILNEFSPGVYKIFAEEYPLAEVLLFQCVFFQLSLTNFIGIPIA